MSDYIQILHRVSNRLTSVKEELEIYQIMNDAIKQILPDSYFFISKLQPEDMNFRIIHSFGFDKFLDPIKTLIGKDPFQTDFPFRDLAESKQKLFKTRKLYHAKGGIFEIVNEIINKTVCKTIEKNLGISEVLVISLCVGESYFGGATLFIPEANLESEKRNKEFTLTIETLAAQVSFAINKLRDFQELAKRESELTIANTKLEYQNKEKKKRADELVIAKEEKGKRADELTIANIELEYQNKEKEKRAVELVSANLALKESKVKYKSMFNNMPDVLWSLSYPDFKPLYISKSAKALYGYTAEQFMNDPMLWINTMHPEDKPLADVAISELKRTGESTRSCRIICSDKSVKTIVDRSWLIYENNVPIRVDGITKDYTKGAQADQALIASEKQLKELNATKDKFFSIIAHDLKSPFNSMLGFSDILNENFEDYDTTKQKKFIGLINQELQGTYKLLENLLYWSRSQEGTIEFKPENVNVSVLSIEGYQLLINSAQNKSIQLINQIPLDVNIEADRDILLTIIRNLISNAIKFTPKQGEILIDAKLIKEEKRVEISVTDTGIGISKETQSKLFKIGENTSTKGTENEKGTGLGLILCKEFVEKHNGQIWVESEIGKGTTFTFTIPIKSMG